MSAALSREDHARVNKVAARMARQHDPKRPTGIKLFERIGILSGKFAAVRYDEELPIRTTPRSYKVLADVVGSSASGSMLPVPSNDDAASELRGLWCVYWESVCP